MKVLSSENWFKLIIGEKLVYNTEKGSLHKEEEEILVLKKFPYGAKILKNEMIEVKFEEEEVSFCKIVPKWFS